MSIPYIPARTNKRFRVPRTLAADFDAFLDRDIPNTNMDFQILKDWYEQFEEGYEPKYVRGEIYADSTKSRYENTDNNMNIRCSVSSGIRKGDMLIEPDGNIYILDWEVHLQSNNAPSRALRCNMILTAFRYKDAEVDDEGYVVDDEGFVLSGEKYAQGIQNHKDIIVDELPVNAYRYDGRPEYSAISGTPGVTPNALTLITVQFNAKTNKLRESDLFIWGPETYEIIDISRVGTDPHDNAGTLKIQARKAAGGIHYE